MPQLGCVWDPDRALELWADLAAEIATLRAEVDAPARLLVPQPALHVPDVYPAFPEF
ncbi:MAG TPA: hypothetical protein VHJ58_09715 [Vicinamibacterales bacterium]|jgi:hypothetical protein|nr:hypothetical protein [Vicinamibacterales bacterium]